MSGCRASLRALLGLVLLAAPTLCAAQGGGPVRLIPGLPGGDAPSGDQRPAERRPVAATPEGVQIESLGAVDPSGLGLLREADGGLPRSLWRGSDRAQVERLVAQIKPTRSPTALTLARRLLLSEADAPTGTAGQPGLFAARIDRLVAIGDPDSAFQLARQVPGDAAAALRAVDAAFLADRGQDACAALPRIPDAARDAAWSKAFAFCRVLAKDVAGGNIQAGLLRERGEADPVFLALMTELSGLGDGKPIEIKAPTPLQIAMLKAANKPPTPATVDALPPAGARLAAEIAAAPADTRLRAAERAFVYGAMPVEDLRTAYGRDEIPAKDIAAALAGKPAEEARTRAALFQAIQRAASPADRDKALVVVLDRLRTREGGLDLRFALTHLDSLLDIKPAPEVIGLAPNGARLLLASGQDLAASEWNQLLQREGRGGSVEAARAAVRLVPLVAIASGSKLERNDLLDWIDAWRAGGKTDAFEARAVTLLSALQGLGREVPVDAWSRLAVSAAPTLGRRPNVATMQALRGAAQAGRLGETIALALIALDGESSAGLEADALASLLDSLNRIGLEREARALALEAAIGLGL